MAALHFDEQAGVQRHALAGATVRAVMAVVAGMLIAWPTFSLVIAAAALWQSPDGMFLAFPPVALYLGSLGMAYNLEALPWLPLVFVAAALGGRSRSLGHALVASVLTAVAVTVPVQLYVARNFATGWNSEWHSWVMLWAHTLSPAAGGFAACWFCGWGVKPMPSFGAPGMRPDATM